MRPASYSEAKNNNNNNHFIRYTSIFESIEAVSASLVLGTDKAR